VLLLAGYRPNSDPICGSYKTLYKSLVPIAGLPMILYPLRSLINSKHIHEIIVLAQEPDVIRKGLRDFHICDKVRFHQSNGGIANTILKCIQDQRLNMPLMITTADNCLLTSDHIDDFLSQALKHPSDLAIGFASKDKVIAAHPETRRTWIPFRDLEVTGCNLFLLTSNRSRELIAFWEKFETSPKKFLRLAWTFGPAFLWRFLARKLTIEESFRRISEITRTTIMPVLLNNPDVSIDADKLSDIRQIETILNHGEYTAVTHRSDNLRHIPVVIFDLDRTITTYGTYTPFLLYYALRNNPLRLLFMPVVLMLMVAYKLHLLDRKQLKALMFGLIIGHADKTRLENVCSTFVDQTLKKNVHHEAIRTIREWQNNDAHLILATASYDWMAELFAHRLKFDNVVSTKSVSKNGKILPGVDGENCYGEAKLRMVTDIISSLETLWQTKREIWFYTDHHTDIPLLEQCHHPVAVNATRKLEKWVLSNPNSLLLNWKSSPTQTTARRFLTALSDVF
jgi:HAD superfamily hydrolase (TIGR01490 family)